MERSFDEVMTELDTVTTELGASDTPLEKQVELYERGTMLVKEADGMLSAIEKRVQIVDAEGALKTFEVE